VYLKGERRLHCDVGYLVIPRLRAEWVEGYRWGDKYRD
jgi:hypothetical protein